MKNANEEQQEEAQISFWEVFDEFVKECGNQNLSLIHILRSACSPEHRLIAGKGSDAALQNSYA